MIALAVPNGSQSRQNHLLLKTAITRTIQVYGVLNHLDVKLAYQTVSLNSRILKGKTVKYILFPFINMTII